MKRTELPYRLIVDKYANCLILVSNYTIQHFTSNGLIRTALLILTNGLGVSVCLIGELVGLDKQVTNKIEGKLVDNEKLSQRIGEMRRVGYFNSLIVSDGHPFSRKYSIILPITHETDLSSDSATCSRYSKFSSVVLNEKCTVFFIQ